MAVEASKQARRRERVFDAELDCHSLIVPKPKHNLRERPAPGKVLDDETLNTALEQRKIAPKKESGKVPTGRKSKAMKAAEKEPENGACRQVFNEVTFEILNDEEVGGDLATTFLSRVQDQIDGVSMCRLHLRRLANGLGMRMNFEDYQLLARLRQLALRSDTWDAWIRDPTPDEEEIDTVVRLSVRWWLLYTIHFNFYLIQLRWMSYGKRLDGPRGQYPRRRMFDIFFNRGLLLLCILIFFSLGKRTERPAAALNPLNGY